MDIGSQNRVVPQDAADAMTETGQRLSWPSQTDAWLSLVMHGSG